MSRVRLALCALVLAAGALVGVQLSSAEFIDGSSTQTRIGAARDWTGPSVVVDDPGFVVTGTTTVTATASDVETSVASVLVEVAPVSSSSWTALCTDDAAPWSCSWTTTSMADGDYRIRATATDLDGNSTTSAEITTTVANTTAIALDPIASPTRGNITLTGRIVNSGSSSTSIRFQGAPAGSDQWQDVPGAGCSGSGTYRSCVFDSTLAADGVYDWRAVGTVGSRTYYDYQRTITVDNTAPALSQSLPGGYLSGTVSWTAESSDALTGVASVVFEYRSAGGSWLTCATDDTAPYSCSLGTATLADGGYELRAVATDRAGNSTTTATLTRTVDNVAPAVALSAPPSPISGPIAMTATATDDGAGVGSVLFQYRLTGASSWTSCAVADTSAPYACTTGNLANGTYELRATATDLNGRATTSTVLTRTVNVTGTVALTAPASGATIWGSTTVTASASSSQTINNVQLQYRITGATSWTTICTDTVTPYTCSWNPSALAYGGYELRALMSYGAGLSVASSAVPVVVPQPGGFDVQGTGSPSSALDTGDTFTLTYTDTMNLSTIASGLTTSSPVTATATVTGGSSGGTQVTFSGANLGTVGYAQQYLGAGRTHVYNVTVAAGTTTANGVTVTRITVTYGSRIQGPPGWLGFDTTSGAMTWTPSSTAKDAAGNGASTATVSELGGADADL